MQIVLFFPLGMLHCLIYFNQIFFFILLLLQGLSMVCNFNFAIKLHLHFLILVLLVSTNFCMSLQCVSPLNYN